MTDLQRERERERELGGASWVITLKFGALYFYSPVFISPHRESSLLYSVLEGGELKEDFCVASALLKGLGYSRPQKTNPLRVQSFYYLKKNPVE